MFRIMMVNAEWAMDVGYQIDRLYLVGNTGSLALMENFKTSSPLTFLYGECKTEGSAQSIQANFPCFQSPCQCYLASVTLLYKGKISTGD